MANWNGGRSPEMHRPEASSIVLSFWMAASIVAPMGCLAKAQEDGFDCDHSGSIDLGPFLNGSFDSSFDGSLDFRMVALNEAVLIAAPFGSFDCGLYLEGSLDRDLDGRFFVSMAGLIAVVVKAIFKDGSLKFSIMMACCDVVIAFANSRCHF